MKYLFSGGGTAGSVTPLLALIEHIRRLDSQAEFLFVGTNDGPEKSLAETAHIDFVAIPAGKMRRYWSSKNIGDSWRVLVGTVAARRVMAKWKPDVVLGAGSYVCVPVGWAAALLRIPVLVHQQDVIPGLANKLVSRFAARITVTFPQSVRDFPSKRTERIGNPVRPEILRARGSVGREFLHIAHDRPIVLFIGGGTGAEVLNRLVTGVVGDVVDTADIVALTGRARQHEDVEDARVHQFPFLGAELPSVMAAATVVVTRAGLGVLSEVAALGKPTIVIPIPQSHQEANAQAMADGHAAIVLDQRRLTPHQLGMAIMELLRDHELRSSLSTAVHRYFTPDAAERLATLAVSHAKHHHDLR